MATRQATVMVANTTTASEWVDLMVFECYSDSGLTQLVQQIPMQTTWLPNSAQSVQNAPVYFRGLNYGQQYWIRCGVQTRATTAYSLSFPVTAGVSTFATVTYGVVGNAVPGGLHFVVTPANVPSDIDHYEAYWEMGAPVVDATPPNTQQPFWRGNVTSMGNFTFSHHLPFNYDANVWVRAINTSHLVQPWVLIAFHATPGNIDSLNDGNQFGRVLTTALLSGAIDSRNSGFLKLGAVSPNWSGTISWTKSTLFDNSASITFSWGVLLIQTLDRNISINANPGFTVGGLIGSPVGSGANPPTAAPTSYAFFPFIDTTSLSGPFNIQFLGGSNNTGTPAPPAGLVGATVPPWSTVVGGSGTQGCAFGVPVPNDSVLPIQMTNIANRIGLSNSGIVITTPIAPSNPNSGPTGGSGSGGGSGHGGDGCPRFGQLVEERTKGIIKIEQVEVGDHLLAEAGAWTRVVGVRHEWSSEFIEISIPSGDSVEQSPETPMPLEDAPKKKSYELSLQDFVRTARGGSRIAALRLRKCKPPLWLRFLHWLGIAAKHHNKVMLQLDAPHHFLCGKKRPYIVTHNLIMVK